MSTDIRPTGQDKYAEEHHEHAESIVEKREEHGLALLPESLRDLSDAERASLEKKMVRKMDLVVM